MMDDAQIELYDGLYFELLSEIRSYQNNETEIPFGKSFDVLTVLELVHVIEKMYDVQRHISTDVCTLFHCTI